MKIKNAVCYSFDLGSQDPMAHVRLLGPLQQAGIHIINGIVNGQSIGEFVLNGDIVVIQRDFPRRLDDYQKVIRIARRERKPIVFDLDDLLLFLPENHPDRMTQYFAPALLPMFQALMEADLVTVATPKLQSTLACYNNNVVVLPNYFDEALWQLRQPVLKSKNKILTIGFMGGDSHKPDIEYVLPILLDLIKRYPHKIRFHFWGMQPPAEMLSLPEVEFTPPYTSLYKDFSAFFQTQSADIFIAPLVDTLFNRCKSPLKYFEYSALGAPGVFSNLETYSDVVSHGKNGLLASSLDEWTDCLMQLIENSDLRFQLATQAQATIRENWLLSQNASKWNDAFEHAIDIMNSKKEQDTHIISIVRSINNQTFDSFQMLSTEAAEKELAAQALKAQLVEHEQAAQVLSAQAVEREQAVQALTAQAEEGEQAVLALSAQLAGKEQAVQALTAQAVDKEQAAQALAAQVAGKEQTVQALTAQAAEREQAVQALSAHLAGKEQAVQALTAQAAEKEQTVQALTTQAAQREQALRAQVAEKEQTVQALTAQSAEREQAVQALSAQLAEREQAMQALTAQAAEREQAVRALSAQLARKKQTVQALKAQVAEREQAVQALTAQVADREQAVQALTAQVAEREQAVQALTAQAAKREQTLSAQLARKKQTVKALKAQAVQVLSTQLAEHEQAVQALTAEREQVVQTLTAQAAEREQALSAQLARKKQTVQALKAQAAERNQAVQALTAQVVEKEQIVQALTAQAAESEKTLSAQLAGMEQVVQALSAQAAEREKQLNVLAGQYQEITISMAWRAALQLRRMRDFLLPPGSLRLRLANKILPLLLFPFNLRRNYRRNQDLRLIRKSGLFDPDWYLANNLDIEQAGLDPLIHYVHFGGFEGRNPGPDFNSAWYLETYKDVKKAGINPLVHYLKYGWKEGRNSSQNNDPSHNLRLSGESGNPESNPLFTKNAAKTSSLSIIRIRKSTRKFLSSPKKAGYIIKMHGWREFFNAVINKVYYQPKLKHKSRSKESLLPQTYQNIYEQLLFQPAYGNDPLFVDFVQSERFDLENKIKLIAFYLPQFHPIAENDHAWGKGFTEWTNVTKAIPQFPGHYQPHIPGELGYYDLRIPEVQERQVELAKNYGIYGFCFYYYWFDGKKLLDRPLNQFISNSNIDFPFCICWANENWTKKWDGRDDEIIIGQKHSNFRDKEFIEDAIPLFRDKRYIRINNRPLLIVYNVKILDNPSELLKAWRKTSIESGVGDPFIVAAQTFEFYDPQDSGFDAAVMFPPHNVLHVPNLRDRTELTNKDYDGGIYSYPDLVKSVIERYKKEPYSHFKTVFPSWDNEPRRPGKGMSFINSTPDVYKYWLRETCRFIKANNSIDEQYVFINAWNEWGEGAHLEPDRKFGYAYLQATKDAILDYDIQNSEKTQEFNGFENQIIKVDSGSINKYKQMYLKIQAENEGKSKDEELIKLYSFDPIPNPEVSIVIPVHNHFETTFNCLYSISNAKEKTSFEVIIIDDCSSDETAQVISACRGILYLRNAKNMGFLKSCNLAARHASGSYLLFLNNDTVVLPGWLDSLVKTFLDHADAGLVGSKLIFPKGTMQEAGSVIWKDGSAMNYGRDDDPDKPEYSYLREVDYCSGASIMIPAGLWKKMGGFDRIYEPAYYEDDDLAFRMRKAGYKVLFQPLSRVFHVEGGTSGIDLSVGVKRYQEINQEKFFQRWKKTLETHGTISQHEFIYRNRYRNKRALVIDVCTPKPDQDSGSIDTYNYLLSLRKMGYEVTFISVVDAEKKDRYVFDLQERGICCMYPPYMISVEDYIQRLGYSFDVVFLFRASFGGKYVDLVKTYAPKAKIVFNTVDLHFLREERQNAISAGRSVIMETEGITRNDELAIMRKADNTILVSEYEKGLINEIAPEVKVSVIPIPREIPGVAHGFSGRKDILFVGGFLHKPNVDAVMDFVEKIWPLINMKIPDIKFHIIGSNIPAGIKSLEDERIKVVGFVEELSEYFTKVKLSVSPLRFGAGVKGKIVTSLSFGVPCVASPIAAEGMELVDNQNILIGNTPEEFAEKVVKLYRSKALWEHLSKNGLTYVKNRNGLEQFEGRLDKLISSLHTKN